MAKEKLMEDDPREWSCPNCALVQMVNLGRSQKCGDCTYMYSLEALVASGLTKGF